MNRNDYVNGMWHVRVTPKIKFTRNKQKVNTMLNVFMNVMCRFGHGFISLYHKHTAATEWHVY